MIATLDPGARAAGVSLWENGELACAGLAAGIDWQETGLKAFHWITDRCPAAALKGILIERPQIYHQSKLKGDPNDLIVLALMAGWVVGRLGISAIEVRPAEWKKQVPKDVMLKRIEARLSDSEKSRIEKVQARLRHNVIDAIGIGLWRYRRL